MDSAATPEFDNPVDESAADETALAIARQVQALVAKDPAASLLSMFDLAVECRRGSTIQFGDLLWLDSEDSFIDLVMEAFCPRTAEHERLAESEDPEEQGRAAELEEFRDAQAIGAFFRRYQLNGHRVGDGRQ